jgi:hypothetical protein
MHAVGSSCCIDVPAVTRVAAAHAARIQFEPNNVSPSPHQLGMLLWVLAAQAPELDQARAAQLVPAYHANASLTYLRTARLRL